MYEARKTGPHRWTVGVPSKDGAFYHSLDFPNSPAANTHAAYLNAKAIQVATERAARNKHRNRNRSNK